MLTTTLPGVQTMELFPSTENSVLTATMQQSQDVNGGPYFNVSNAFPEPSQARSHGNKRKSEDKDQSADGNQGRAKRNRYIRSVLSTSGGSTLRHISPGSDHKADCWTTLSIACNECKRRKIRCNGNTPCERCSKLSLDCIFATNGGGPDFKESE